MAVGLEAALGLRAPAAHASTPMVRQLAVQMCRRLGLEGRDQALVDLAVRVRDVGMLGLPDAVVLATGPLCPEEWELVNRHPALGADLLQGLPGMAGVAAVVRAHHERWDGEGYPDGLSGEQVPLLSRVIATADAFVAMASDRPYRKSVGAEAALDYVCQERGSQFDPRTVEVLIEVLSGKPSSDLPVSIGGTAAPRSGAGLNGDSEPASVRDLKQVLAEFDVLPAFATAHERVQTLASGGGEAAGDLVAAIESDIGLTVAVLRFAQAARKRGRIANVADSVATLNGAGVAEAIGHLPRAAFPWQTSMEAVLHGIRIHGQAVARAADRIAREVGMEAKDELIAAALLHDVGKLVLARLRRSDQNLPDERSAKPEQRVRLERRLLSMDHASLSSLLIQRWQLPGVLSDAAAGHHSADQPGELATFLRLADLIARHAHGDSVDRKVMLELAASCDLPISVLRDILFDLPHAGGSQRRRAAPSPLSNRETTVLRALAEGKLYKDIAGEVGLSVSTVRTHLHNAYAKLAVQDRAQAVLKATEMAWI